MSYILGLTGPTGSGKSTISKYAKTLGWHIVDCDLLARKAVEKEEALKKLADVFGSDILNSDNSLNRKVLAEKAFSAGDKTELLNKTVLPYIVKLVKEEIEKANSDKIILDAPTLYESGADLFCDDVLVITSSVDKRKKRIINRDHIDEKDALLRINAGKDDEFYKDKTLHIIYNDFDEETLKNEFMKMLEKLGGK